MKSKVEERDRMRRRGMTLIELSVVLLILLTLLSVLMMGAVAWKRGGDRAGCIMNIRYTQVAVRSLANLSGFNAGEDVSPFDVKDALIGMGDYLDDEPECPAGGAYTYGGNVIPVHGALYLGCSLAARSGHVPEVHSAW